jgi:hypothetical protein
MELMNSRCKACSPQAFQCSDCASLDRTVKKNLRLAKKNIHNQQLPSVLFSDVPSSHVYPPMPAPAPLFVNGQVLVPVSIASPGISRQLSVHGQIVPLPLALSPPKTVPLSGATATGVTDFEFLSPLHNGKRHCPPSLKRPVKPKPADLTDTDHSGHSDSSVSATGHSTDAEEAEEDTSGLCVLPKQKPKMSRITNDERAVVCIWIFKTRSDGRMTNGRWIRNGGAKGSSMTATSGEVKTSGAHDALAAYGTMLVSFCFCNPDNNPQVRQQKAEVQRTGNKVLDTRRVQKTMDRIVHLLLFSLFIVYIYFYSAVRYKSFKDAINLGSKGNSKAGASAHQIASNSTSLIVLQHKKCPCFEKFSLCFGQTPNVKPVDPQEIGGMAPDTGDAMAADNIPDSFEDDIDFGMDQPVSPCVAADSSNAAAKASVAAASATAAQGAADIAYGKKPLAASALAAVGKGPAQFHLAPSKKAPKMDLGEAYLKAQQSKIESVAVMAQAKTRCELVIALTQQGKTAVEIAEFLLLTGY